MKMGTFYGVGVGPGDPELVTVKAANIIASCGCIVAPRSSAKTRSIALDIAGRYIKKGAEVIEQEYPMTSDEAVLKESWRAAARETLARLRAPQDVCFLTLGDPLFYSTHIYLLRALKELEPALRTVTVPGITAMSAASAITDFPLGESRKPVTVIPVSDDLSATRRAIAAGGNVVLMKVGKRLPAIIALLEETGAIGNAVFVARAGMEGQVVETDPRKLKNSAPDAGYFSIILVDADAGKSNTK